MKEVKYQKKRPKPLLVKEEALAYKIQQKILTDKVKRIKKDYGIFFTPEPIVDFTVNLIDMKRLSGKRDISILEPACGLAQFLIGIKRNSPALFRKARLFGVEINHDIVSYLTNLNIKDDINLINADYLLWSTDERFDLIIGNPPYGIPSLSEHYTIRIDSATKQKYKDIYETWYGKYNVYGAFIEKSVKLLKPEGQLTFIVPATFMILDEFRRLRTFLASQGSAAIIYMGPDVFKPEADVAAVILKFHKSRNSYLELLEYRDNRVRLIKNYLNWQGEVIKFETNYSRKIEGIASGKLGDVYDIRISPRTPEIRHSPYIIKGGVPDKDNYLPLLNGRNLKCHKIIYDNLTGYWIKKSEVKRLRGYFNTSHVVVGLGFRENGKVAAAYDEKSYPWMGDVYHLLKKSDLFLGNFDLDEQETVDYLNSDYLRRYVKDVYREITYHLSITQLKNLPLPNKKEWRAIKRMGYEEKPKQRP